MSRDQRNSRLEVLAGPLALAYLLWDDEDRPLGEANNPIIRRLLAEREGEDAASETTDDSIIVLAASNATGSRAGKLVNVSALRQVHARWTEVLADVTVLRADYLGRVGRERMTVGDLWRYAMVTTALPAYLYRRTRAPYGSEAIPARVSATFKVMQGVSMTAGSMLDEGVSPDSPASTDEFLAFTESRGIFVVADRACAGPEAMIREMIEAIIDGGVRTGDQGLAPIIGDVDRFWAYASSATDAHVVAKVYAAESARWRERIRSEVSCDAELNALVAADPPRATPTGLGVLLADPASRRLADGAVHAIVAARSSSPAVSALLLEGLAIEQWTVRRLSDLDATIMSAIEREPHPTPLRGTDLARVAPPPSALLGAWLGKSIDVEPDAISVGERG